MYKLVSFPKVGKWATRRPFLHYPLRRGLVARRENWECDSCQKPLWVCDKTVRSILTARECHMALFRSMSFGSGARGVRIPPVLDGGPGDPGIQNEQLNSADNIGNWVLAWMEFERAAVMNTVAFLVFMQILKFEHPLSDRAKGSPQMGFDVRGFGGFTEVGVMNEGGHHARSCFWGFRKNG
jgi:hypothetical protein